MSTTVDLRDSLCPMAVVNILREISTMKEGEERHFIVTDPLAEKSIPQELKYENISSLDIVKEKKQWRVIVIK